MSSRGPPSHACHPPDWFELLICPSLSLFEHIASPQSCQWVVFFFWGGGFMFMLYFVDSSHVHILRSLNPQASLRSVPPFSYLHPSPTYSSISSSNLSRLLPPLSVALLFSISLSLFRHCSGWSPCGTPCRVPNLFIISALCKDARGMLKYTPPLSGYKWAAVSHAGFQMTWTQGWTERPNTNAVLKFRAKAPARPPARSSATNGPSLGTDPAKNTRAQKLSALAGCLERTQPRQKLSSETSLRPD